VSSGYAMCGIVRERRSNTVKMSRTMPEISLDAVDRLQGTGEHEVCQKGRVTGVTDASCTRLRANKMPSLIPKDGHTTYPLAWRNFRAGSTGIAIVYEEEFQLDVSSAIGGTDSLSMSATGLNILQQSRIIHSILRSTCA
jgi:hypothetical protein